MLTIAPIFMGLAAAVVGGAVGEATVDGGAVVGGVVVEGAALVDGGALEVAGAGVEDEQPANMKLAVIRMATKRTSNLRINFSYIHFSLFGSEFKTITAISGSILSLRRAYFDGRVAYGCGKYSNHIK